MIIISCFMLIWSAYWGVFFPADHSTHLSQEGIHLNVVVNFFGASVGGAFILILLVVAGHPSGHGRN